MERFSQSKKAFNVYLMRNYVSIVVADYNIINSIINGSGMA